MVAFHFPPLAGSSGIQRTLRFVQQLPRWGWQPLVLSAHPRAYEQTGTDLLGDIPDDTVVERAFALDMRRIALRGRYVAALARPDRWISWKFDAVRRGLRMIERYRPAAIWSTYPIATAHAIGAELQRRSGLPWLADFRDPMAQDGYPADPKTWRSFKAIEQRAIEAAACSVFTTPSAARAYRTRYPAAASRIVLLENGYDEDSFAAAEAALGAPQPLNPGAVTLLHSGIVYPSERDPTQLMAALGRLRRQGRVSPQGLRLRFRAAVHDDLLRRLAEQHGVADLVETLPPLPYRDALAEMMCADALLVMQGDNCNEQVPAKVYEYLRAKRPILCLADPAGDTAAVMREAGADAIAKLESGAAIEAVLPPFVQAVATGSAVLASAAAVQRASREQRSAALAGLLQSVG
ncbi:MAG TPA: glycosyltransferase [Burkholderiaceae bacterium]|nr:glycosyltransferase [Burkholderiaceae bacterium]